MSENILTLSAVSSQREEKEPAGFSDSRRL